MTKSAGSPLMQDYLLSPMADVGVSLLSSGLGFPKEIVSHTTKSEHVSSILKEINLNSHWRNLYGGKAFYVAQGAMSHSEADGDKTVVFEFDERKARILDTLNPDVAKIKKSMNRKKFIEFAHETSDAIKYESFDRDDSWNMALLKSPDKFLKPIGIYPVPESDEVPAFSIKTIKGLKAFGLGASALSVLAAGTEIWQSQNKVSESLHQAGLLAAGFGAGTEAGTLALVPCGSLGLAFPAAAPVSVPVCMTVASLTGGAVGITAAEKTWQAMHDVSSTSQLWNWLLQTATIAASYDTTIADSYKGFEIGKDIAPSCGALSPLCLAGSTIIGGTVGYAEKNPALKSEIGDFLSSTEPDADHTQSLSLNHSNHDKQPFRIGSTLGKTPTWLDKTSFLYRGDGRGFDEVFENGFTARGKDTSVVNHFSFSEEDNSAFISTSIEKEVAGWYPTSSDLPEVSRTTTYLYEIRLKNPPFDLPGELRKLLQSGGIPRPDPDEWVESVLEDDYGDEGERIVLSKIPPDDIYGGWPVDIERKLVDETEEEPEDRYHDTRTVHEQFTPNPNYVAPMYPGQRLWHAGRFLGHTLTGVGLALDGASLYREYGYSKESGDFSNTYREGIRIASAWPSAWVMGMSFAQIGAAGCVSFTPIASAICGIGFGLAGSVIGYYGGGAAATRIYDASNSNSPAINARASIYNSGQSFTFFQPSISPLTPLPLEYQFDLPRL